MRKMQQKKEVECNHIVLDSNWSNEKLISNDELQEFLEQNTKWQNHLAENYVGYNKINKLDILDRRKGYASLFNFCPICGVKIDWKQIKETIS